MRRSCYLCFTLFFLALALGQNIWTIIVRLDKCVFSPSGNWSDLICPSDRPVLFWCFWCCRYDYGALQAASDGRIMDYNPYLGSSTQVGGTLSDIWKTSERSVPMAIFSFVAVLGE